MYLLCKPLISEAYLAENYTFISQKTIKVSIFSQAMDENIDIIKLPPHTTDKLQPLDVCCFKSLKSVWDKNLAKWTSQHRARRVTKYDFLGMVSNVWGQCFTTELITKAFEKCGLYPFNRDRYPITEFAPNLLAVYQREKQRRQEVSQTYSIILLC